MKNTKICINCKYAKWKYKDTIICNFSNSIVPIISTCKHFKFKNNKSHEKPEQYIY